MKVLQWSMTIPKNKQSEFLMWFYEIAMPQLTCYGALKHEIYQVANKEVVGRQTIEDDKFIERIYFPDDFNIPDYFTQIKRNKEKWALSRMYEEKFNAKDIELRILINCELFEI